MINFCSVPTLNDWDNISDEKYYPDNNHLNFLNKSCDDLIACINQPTGINIIFSLHEIPKKPFHFYTLCILKGILNQKIPLTEYYSEMYLDDVIWAIKTKISSEFSAEYIDFINPLENIISNVKSLNILTLYDQTELSNI